MRFLKADNVFNGKEFLPENTVLVLDDRNLFRESIPENDVEKSKVEHFEGIITPGFINTHCHLELSHLKNKIACHTGLPGFARQVITQRNTCSKEEIAAHMKAADLEMQRNGIVAVGDISNGSDSFHIKTGSPVFYHTFIELIGLDPAKQQLIFDKGTELLEALKKYNLQGSFAPHAPYSTSTALIKTLAAYNADMELPLSIHNQESEEEAKFFEGKKNGFEELFSFLGLDISWFKAPGGTSLKSYVDTLSTKHPSVLVHNTFTSSQDLLTAASKNISWCFCPGANVYIENRLPDYSLFKGLEHKICFGTDSLASNTHLNLIEEARLVLKNTDAFPLKTILRALTLNAAEALNISNNFGGFIPGKNAGLNLVSFKNNDLHFIKKIL